MSWEFVAQLEQQIDWGDVTYMQDQMRKKNKQQPDYEFFFFFFDTVHINVTHSKSQ